MSTAPDVFGHAVDDRGRAILGTGPIDRPHYAASVTGCTDDTLWKRYMREWYGLTPVRGLAWLTWAWCPHRVVGQRCDEGACAWRKDHNPGGCGVVWDHARAWRNADGDLVLTLEPYGNPFDAVTEFADIERDLDALDVVTCFEGRSPYGASYIVFLMAADTEAGQRAQWVRDMARRHANARRRLSRPD